MSLRVLASGENYAICLRCNTFVAWEDPTVRAVCPKCEDLDGGVFNWTALTADGEKKSPLSMSEVRQAFQEHSMTTTIALFSSFDSKDSKDIIIRGDPESGSFQYVMRYGCEELPPWLDVECGRAIMTVSPDGEERTFRYVPNGVGCHSCTLHMRRMEGVGE